MRCVKPTCAVLFLFVLQAISSLNASEEVDAESPNFILIMADDLGWGDTSYNGHPILKTPGLDAMAKNGLRFNRFYAAAPVCSPTRGSCLTGRHPFRYGVFSANIGHLKSDEVSVAEYLRSKGYRTGHFGKWHLGTLTKNIKDSNRGGPDNSAHFSPPSEHGFEEYFSTEAKTPTFDPLLKPAGKVSRQFWLPIKERKKAVPYGTRYWNNGSEVKKDLAGDDSAIIMDQALKFIERSAEEKFLAVIWFHAPHLPVVASNEDRAPFDKLDPYTQSYLGSIRALDRQIVRLRESLRQRGLAQNTMVCFCSDNGPEGKATAPGKTAKLRGRKRSLYEGGIRVPGIIEWPKGIEAGQVTDFVACTSDYMPTIVEITGGNLPGRPYDGVSLLELLKTPLLKRPSPVFFQTKNRAAMIGNQFKLVAKVNRDLSNLQDVELYDIEKDPTESRNLAQDRSEVANEMSAKLESWRKSCRQSLSGKDYRSN